MKRPLGLSEDGVSSSGMKRPLSEADLPYSRKKRKRIRRIWTERNLRLAKKYPERAAKFWIHKQWIQDCGLEQATHEVLEMIKNVERDGRIYTKEEESSDVINGTEKDRPRQSRTRPEGILPNEVMKPKNLNKPWDPVRMDQMIDALLAEEYLPNIASQAGVTPKAVARQKEHVLLYNELCRKSLEYVPIKRKSRQGLRHTKMEKRLIKAHLERKIPIEVTAKILQRSPAECKLEWKPSIPPQRFGKYSAGEDKRAQKKNLKNSCHILGIAQDLVSGTDVLLAHRYLYYCLKRPIITNRVYNEAKAEEMEFGIEVDKLEQDASDRVKDYPEPIRALAQYMLYRHELTQLYPALRYLPYGWEESNKKA